MLEVFKLLSQKPAPKGIVEPKSSNAQKLRGSDAEEIIGMTAFVTSAVNNSFGQVLVGETQWPARSLSFDAEYAEDSLVIVSKVKNGIAFVFPKETHKNTI